jgi:signal transduction histidine kinase
MRYLLLLIIFFTTAVYAQKYKHLEAIGNHNEALNKLFAALKKDRDNPELFCQIAERNLLLEKYDSAILFCNKAIEYLTKNKNITLLSRAYHIKGNTQYNLDDKKNTEENWRMSLSLSQSANDLTRAAKLSSNLAAIYLDRAYTNDNPHLNKQYYAIADSFFSLAKKNLILTDSLTSKHGLLTLRLIATSFHFQKKYDSAEYYYQKVIRLSKEKKNMVTYLGAISFYPEMLADIGKHEQALYYIKEAMQLVNSDSSFYSKDKTHVMHIYGTVLNKAGNFKEAYLMNDSAYQSLAADYQKVNAKAYSESESKFKNQILQYQIEAEQQKKKQLYYLVAGLIILAAFVVLWLQNRNNKRIAKEKATQKQISIDAFIEGEEKEKARIGRELHDGIAQEIVGIKLAMHQQNADPKLIEELTRISLDIRNISHELMPQTLKEYGLKLAIEDICQKILAPSGIQFELHSSLPEERLPNKIEITLYRIFQELAHNIIKHSHATEVLVQLRKMNNHILLVVEDNGKGMTEEKKNGIGISNLKSRVQLLDGNLQYDSSDNEGTTAIVRVPI